MVKIFQNLLGGAMKIEPETPNDTKEEKRVVGKIIKVSSDGYGFISSKEIPFTRIFFHWTSLRPDTIKFQDLRSGMKVSFVAFEVEDKGWRAIKIKMEENE
jgi:cold shock CspA family protein